MWYISVFNPYPAKLVYLNFQPLEVVSRYRDPQPQVVKNYSYLFNLRPNIYKFDVYFISYTQWFNRLITLIKCEDVPLDMKGCICYFAKWQIHPFISNGTKSYHMPLVTHCLTEPELDKPPVRIWEVCWVKDLCWPVTLTHATHNSGQGRLYAIGEVRVDWKLEKTDTVNDRFRQLFLWLGRTG